MSGVLNPDEPGIVATDNEDIARTHGLTEWDGERGQWVAPACESDGADAQPGGEQALIGEDGSEVQSPPEGAQVVALGDEGHGGDGHADPSEQQA